MQTRIHELSQKVKSVLINYPMVLAMAVLMASTIVFMVETDWKPSEDFTPMRIIITAALGISMMFAIKMFSQRIGKELLLHVAGLAFLVGYFFVLPAKEDDFSDMHVFVLFPTFVLSHLLVAFIPFIGKDPEIKFWQYNKNLFINIFLTVVFTGVLTGGVELAIASVDQLFDMEFKGDIYGETFAVMGIVGSVFVFLLFNEKGLTHLEKDGSYPVVLKFFTQFILIPLLLIYVVILYFYSAKILLNWELPEGWVSYLVLAYSIVGILALLLVHPLKDAIAKSWVKVFSGIFYFSLLPLIVLLFVAIFTRLLQYGFTEARYYVLLLAVWLLGVVLYFIFIKRATIKFIPISLFLFGLFALVFPYFNAFSVSDRSQKAELEQLLNHHQLLDNGKIKFAAKIPYEVAHNISDKFVYLSDRFEYDYLSSFLDAKTRKGLNGKDSWYIDHLFINKLENDAVKRHTSLFFKRTYLYDEVGNYHYVIRQDDLLGDGVKINNDLFTLRMNTYTENPIFVLKVNDVEADLMPDIKRLFRRHKGNYGTIESDSLFVVRDIGGYQVKVAFRDLRANTYNDKVNYEVFDALFFIKK